MDKRSKTFHLLSSLGSVRRWLLERFHLNLPQFAGHSGRESLGHEVDANAAGGRSHRELMAHCQGLWCGLLGGQPSLDTALALGNHPSAAPSATGSHSWGQGASVSLPTRTPPRAKRLTPESAAAFNLSLL